MRASSRVKEEISAPSFSIFSGAATAATGRTWEERKERGSWRRGKRRKCLVGECVVEDDGEWRESVGIVVERGFVVAISDDGESKDFFSSLLWR